MQLHHSLVVDVVGQQLTDLRRGVGRSVDALEPRVEALAAVETLELLDLESGIGDEFLPVVLGVAAHVRRIA